MITIPPWYRSIPKDPAKNRRWRISVWKEALESRRCRDYVKRACKEDTLFYFNGFLFTFDPRLPDGEKVLPFITFPSQDRAILEIEEAIDNRHDLVSYKSRDVGVSWICLGVFEKKWHFERDNTFFCLSRNEDAVDGSGNEDALFTKIDRIHRYLPQWLMPKGWNPQKHRIDLTFINPELDSTISGGATVAAAAVGGRRTAILLDEFSRVDKGNEINLGTADVTDCRIFNFTAYGKGNEAWELLQNPRVKKLCLHWSADPRKNRKMYRWDGNYQKYRYYRYDESKEPEPLPWAPLVLTSLVECGPHQYGTEDADTKNYRSDNGYPKGRPFEPIPDGVLRSPAYDIEDTRRGNRRYMAINWDIDFEGSDDRVFDVKLLVELVREFASDPFWEGEVVVDEAAGELVEFRTRRGGPLRLWCPFERLIPLDDERFTAEFPRSETGFGVGCDISRGKGATPSCASFGRIDDGEKVAEYVTPHEKPEVFAAKVVALSKLFRSFGGSKAFLAWEKLGPGEDFAKTVMDLGYSNVYYDGVEFGEEVSKGRKPGWTPNRTSIRTLLSEYEMALRQRRFKNRSKVSIEECERFVETPQGIKYRGSRGANSRWVASDEKDDSGATENHGDRVVADALCQRAIRTVGGVGAGDLARPKEVPPEEVPGTLAWRMALHKKLDRQKQEAWS